MQHFKLPFSPAVNSVWRGLKAYVFLFALFSVLASAFCDYTHANTAQLEQQFSSTGLKTKTKKELSLLRITCSYEEVQTRGESPVGEE